MTLHSSKMYINCSVASINYGMSKRVENIQFEACIKGSCSWCLQLSFTPTLKVLVTTNRAIWVQIENHFIRLCHYLCTACGYMVHARQTLSKYTIRAPLWAVNTHILSDVCRSLQLLSGKRSVWMGDAGCLMKRREVRGTRLTAGGSVKERQRRKVWSTVVWSWGKSASLRRYNPVW